MRSIIRTLAILFAIRSVASAQIQDLATTFDGGQTYFSTAYRQKNSAQAGYLKIFRIAENGLELFRQVTISYEGNNDTNFFLAERPSLSSDGRVVAYNAGRSCSGGSHCIAFVYNQGWLAGAADRDLGAGVLTVSPDGHSYVLYNYADFGASALKIGDLQSGNTVGLQRYTPIGDGRQSLANGPIALLSLSSTPGLWKAGQFTPLLLNSAPTHARLNAAGDMIVYETSSATNIELHSYSVASGLDTLLAIGGTPMSYQPLSYFHPWLTADGRYVSYVLANRLLLQSTGSTQARTLTSPIDGMITSSVIAGSGNVAFVGTSVGQLLRIDVATGAKTELISAVPHLEVTGGAQVPGGRINVMYTGQAAGDPALAGAGADAPVVGRSENMITLQIPWEAGAPSTVTLVFPKNPSALEEAHDLALQFGIPVFYTLPVKGDPFPPYALAAHEDFSDIVSDSKPARRGEILHVYFTGLGAVSPMIGTGSVTPVNPLFRLQTPFDCQFQHGMNIFPAEIRFAGLAPGTIGVEQVDIVVPGEAAPPSISVNCVSRGPIEFFNGFAQLPIAP